MKLYHLQKSVQTCQLSVLVFFYEILTPFDCRKSSSSSNVITINTSINIFIFNINIKNINTSKNIFLFLNGPKLEEDVGVTGVVNKYFHEASVN